MKVESGDQTISKENDMRSAFNAEPFSDISSNEWYQASSSDKDRTAIRNEFIANESIIDPDLEYGKIAKIDYRALEKLYFDLLEQAITSGDDIFYEQVAQKLAEMYRHKEVHRRLGGDAINNIALSQERAETMNEEIFGEIKQEDFDVVFSKHVSNARQVAQKLPEAEELLMMIGTSETLSSESFNFELKPETIRLLREDLFAIFPKLEAALAPHEDRQVGIDESIGWADKILTAVGMYEEGWRGKKVEGKSAANTNTEERLIEFGADRPAFESTTAMNDVIVHEVIGHGWLSLQAKRYASRSKKPATDEGVPTALQQLISGRGQVFGQRYLFAIGLGKGMDQGGVKRSFRAVYEILYRSIMVNDEVIGKSVDKLAAQQKAFQECLRTRRGGVIDMRDISYFTDSKKADIWMNKIAQLSADERREKFRSLLSERFDPTSEAHAELFKTDIE